MIANISTEHRSGRRISRAKISWLINEVLRQRTIVTDIIKKIDEFEDTEEMIKEAESIREAS